jgi:hypothetical protein
VQGRSELDGYVRVRVTSPPSRSLFRDAGPPETELQGRRRDSCRTVGGVLELEQGGLRVTLIKAVVKASQRAKELLFS